MDQQQTKIVLQATLEKIELELRSRIMLLASKHDYNAIVFNDDRVGTVGDQMRTGLNSRWLNIMRLLSMKNFNAEFILQELKGDIKTLIVITKALP